MSSKKAFHVLLVLAAASMSACGGSQKKVQAPPPSLDVPAVTTLTSAPAADAPVAVSPSITVSEDILRRCHLSLANVERAPKFAFDDSELLTADRDVLQLIAACVTAGPLKGSTLELIGRTDPRGTIEYNLALGARRAARVASYLGTLGVASTNMRETSRGELDATGYDEATWQIDRRVDIRLAP